MHKYPRKANYTDVTRDLLFKDMEYISPSYTRDYPFVVLTGEGREVMDVDGNWYLDFGAGIAVTSTGHCHPKVVAAIKKQAERLIHMSGTDFYYKSQINLAEKLVDECSDMAPAMAFFCNSGAEAVEAAMKLAKFYTNRPGFIAFNGAFHGRTLGALSLTASKAIQSSKYLPTQPVAHTPYPNCRKCWFNQNKESCANGKAVCIQYLQEEIIDRGIMPAGDCAAIFVEPIQGEGGYIVPPDFWWQDLDDLASRNNILVVVDEIQAGMGRTGKWFAHHNFETTKGNHFRPDIITVAKGIASGMPLGVMLAKKDIMQYWSPGSHASTFGGNPISCEAALTTIHVIEEEGLLNNAETQGKYLRDRLSMLDKSLGPVENIRGLGLMTAIDIVGGTVEDSYCNSVLNRCFEKGLILLGCGKHGIRFCPALNVTKEEIDTCICILQEAIEEVIK